MHPMALILFKTLPPTPPNYSVYHTNVQIHCGSGQLTVILICDGLAPTSSRVVKQSSLRSSQYLSEGALSPDGTVLATASHDGFVKFWQIYIEGQDEPR